MIFYFSGTGNSRWAAEKIAEALDEQMYEIGEMMLAKERVTIMPNERVGFVFPVNGWMPPKIVREFVSRLQVLGDQHYCYCLMTAGDSIGEAMHVMKNDLLMIGLQLKAGFTLIMPESYVCLPGFYTDKPQKEQKKKRRAQELLSEYITEINEGKNVWHLVKGFMPFVLTYVLGIPFNKVLVTDKPFRVDATRCTHCGRCAKVCPIKNIVMNDENMPTWKRDGTCTNCMACYHHCPVHAINHWTTKNKGQYYYKNDN